MVFSLVLLGSISTQARVFLLDFGPTPAPDGPDANGNHWNTVNKPVVHYLEDVSKVFASIGLHLKTDYAAGSNGGLGTPSKELLGRFSAAFATSDYFYNAGRPVTTFKLVLLDLACTYNFRFFATRNAQDTRETTYTVTGGNGPFTADLQTSGADVGGGNGSRVVSIQGVKPDTTGEIEVSFSTKSGGFSYLGAMELEVVEPSTVQ